ncbi:hypothetical protein ACSQ6I_27690 [Anabaena sp. WFMT]|uniref:hypothetical protein n=1 Tax=Anabaena sp. WFMT TaxID=3449730 RepID=UPI003F24204A
MQQLTVILAESVTTLKPNFPAVTAQNNQTQTLTANLFVDTDLDAGTITILKQIEAEHEYYQSCGEW